MAECNICGGNVFSAAPNNRLSRKKSPPLCAKCGSLERDRIGRDLASAIRIREKFKSYALLDVGRNATVPKGWFSSSREIQVGDSEIERLAGNRVKFDFIVCSHVIQKLRDPRRSVRNMVNSLSDDGVLLLNYPSPVTRKVTERVGGTRRTNEPLFIFGRDFEQEYKAVAPDAYVVAAEGADPVTQDDDIMYFLTKNPIWATRIVKTLNSRLVQ
jgi:SAM-dependent methyltransferase